MDPFRAIEKYKTIWKAKYKNEKIRYKCYNFYIKYAIYIIENELAEIIPSEID